MATKNGQIKGPLKDFEVSRYSKAITCMKVKEQDTMICALLTDNNKEYLLFLKLAMVDYIVNKKYRLLV